MKSKITLSLVILLIMSLLTHPTIAQSWEEDDDDMAIVEMEAGPGFGPGGGFQGMRQEMIEELKLTSEQTRKLRELRVAHQKEMIPLRADLKVLNIELQELIRSDAKQSEIDGKIDKIASSRAQLEKKMAAHRMAMRQILTPEQKEMWDSRPHRFGMQQGKMGKMRGEGMGDRMKIRRHGLRER